MRRTSGAIRVALASVGHDHQMSVVDHLDELRTRMIVILMVVGVAFAFCFWQNHRILQLVNAPLSHATQKQTRSGEGLEGSDYVAQKTTSNVTAEMARLTKILDNKTEPASVRKTLAELSTKLTKDAGTLRATANSDGDKPVTLGITEPFNTTIGVTLIFALILSLPVILLQVYGFFVPAVDDQTRRRMRPVLFAVPGLFILGVVFGYLVVLPAAVRFLQNFNSNQFNVLVQASPYYHFAAMILLAMGLVFEVPVMIIGLTTAGTVTPQQLRKGRKFALVACFAIGAFLPGDALTMLLEALPLYCLFEIGIALASLLDRRQRRRTLATAPGLGASA